MALPALAFPESKSFGTHLIDYMSSADGPADFFDFVQVFASHAKNLPISPEQRAVAENIRAHSSDVWSLLVFPDIISEGTKWIQKTGLFIDGCVQGSDAQTVQGAAKDALLQSVDFLNTIGEGGTFLHNKKWVDLGAAGPWMGGLYSTTSLISDGVDMHAQISNLQDPAACAESQWLSIVKLVKDVASILLSLISLTALILGIAIETVFLLPSAALGLSTVFIISKIYGYFYERVVVETTRVVDG
jgi:hypothetical protein